MKLGRLILKVENVVAWREMGWISGTENRSLSFSLLLNERGDRASQANFFGALVNLERERETGVYPLGDDMM